MSRRFFFQSDPAKPPESDDLVQLDPRESHHLIHVMRCQTGDRLELFDGSGYQFESEITDIGRSDVSVRLLSRNLVDLELDLPLVVAIPFPKADRQKFLVEKLTEIGVAVLVFLKTARSGEQGKPKTIDRLKQTVVEASKQCGRNRLMEIRGPEPLDYIVEVPYEVGYGDMDYFFAHPQAVDQTTTNHSQPTKKGGKLIAIGPEGGFDQREIKLMEKNSWRPMNLGKTILRMETAAIVAATLLRE